jgi:hypothetical protein
MEQIRRIAPQDTTLRLDGETGTGKTQLARMIPELWKGEPAIPMVFATISTFLQRTERIVAVIVRSERHSHDRDDPTSPESAALIILRRNHASRLLTTSVCAVLDQLWDFTIPSAGTPLGAMAFALHLLNTARKDHLASQFAAEDFQPIRSNFIAGIRKELAKRVPPLTI